MRVVFHDHPETVLRRLKAPYPPSWTSVLIGESQQLVSIDEYVHREKYETLLQIVTELTHKGRLPIFSDRPERLEAHIRKTVKRIIDLMQGE